LVSAVSPLTQAALSSKGKDWLGISIM